MCRLSIIIPFEGNPEALEATIISVLENRPDECEVLVVHPGTYDNPYGLEDDEVRIISLNEGTVVSLLNAGIRQSQGAVIGMVREGFCVTPDWSESALDHFSDATVGCVCPLAIQGSQPDRVYATGVSYGAGGRRRLTSANKRLPKNKPIKARPLGPALALGFYARTALDHVGELDVHMSDQFADVDLAVLLNTLGFRTVFEPCCQLVGQSGPATDVGSFKTGLIAERLFWRHAPHVGWLRSLAQHPFTVAADLFRAGRCGRLAGRLAGSLSLLSHLKHYAKVRRLRSEVADGLTVSASADGIPEPDRIAPHRHAA